MAERKAVVMVVDDDQSLIETMGDMFQILNYGYFGLSHKPVAENVRLSGCPDLLIVDQMLDGPQDGIEFTQRLKARGLTCPVIAFSASPHMLEAAEQSGLFAACIPKPFDLFAIAELMRKLIAGEDQ